MIGSMNEDFYSGVTEQTSPAVSFGLLGPRSSQKKRD